MTIKMTQLGTVRGQNSGGQTVDYKPANGMEHDRYQVKTESGITPNPVVAPSCGQ